MESQLGYWLQKYSGHQLVTFLLPMTGQRPFLSHLLLFTFTSVHSKVSTTNNKSHDASSLEQDNILQFIKCFDMKQLI